MFYMGREVREYRQKVAPDISAADFAEEVEISPSDLSKIETNKKRLTMTHVVMMLLRYSDRTLYYRYKEMEDEFVFGSLEKKKLVSI